MSRLFGVCTGARDATFQSIRRGHSCLEFGRLRPGTTKCGATRPTRPAGPTRPPGHPAPRLSEVTCELFEAHAPLAVARCNVRRMNLSFLLGAGHAAVKQHFRPRGLPHVAPWQPTIRWWLYALNRPRLEFRDHSRQNWSRKMAAGRTCAWTHACLVARRCGGLMDQEWNDWRKRCDESRSGNGSRLRPRF